MHEEHCWGSPCPVGNAGGCSLGPSPARGIEGAPWAHSGSRGSCLHVASFLLAGVAAVPWWVNHPSALCRQCYHHLGAHDLHEQ